MAHSHGTELARLKAAVSIPRLLEGRGPGWWTSIYGRP